MTAASTRSDSPDSQDDLPLSAAGPHIGRMDAAFKGNVVLVTGASTGIGREMAIGLAKAGAKLVLAARGEDALSEVAAECRGFGGLVLPVPTDVGDEAACRRLVGEGVAEFGRLDTLITNAGITMWARFDEMQDLTPFREIIRVNYFGSVYCTRYALPHLVRSRGRIVAVSSLTGKTGVPSRSGYAASKHAVTGFFESLRIELHGSGVTVTIVFPGYVATDVRRKAAGPDGQPIGDSPVEEHRAMSAERCATLILEAAAARKRQVIMSARGKVGMWLKLVAPGVVDWLAERAIRRGR